MSNMPDKQSGLTFQDIAARLPPDKLKRLAEIKKAYPHIRLEGLPDGVRHEVRSILQIGIDAVATVQTRTDQTRPGVKSPADYSSLLSITVRILIIKLMWSFTRKTGRRGFMLSGRPAPANQRYLHN